MADQQVRLEQHSNMVSNTGPAAASRCLMSITAAPQAMVANTASVSTATGASWTWTIAATARYILCSKDSLTRIDSPFAEGALADTQRWLALPFAMCSKQARVTLGSATWKPSQKTR